MSDTEETARLEEKEHKPTWLTPYAPAPPKTTDPPSSSRGLLRLHGGKGLQRGPFIRTSVPGYTGEFRSCVASSFFCLTISGPASCSGSPPQIQRLVCVRGKCWGGYRSHWDHP